MPGDEDRTPSGLRVSGLVHTLGRLIEEAAALGLPVTEIALRTALIMCNHEINSGPSISPSMEYAQRGMLH